MSKTSFWAFAWKIILTFVIITQNLVLGLGSSLSFTENSSTGRSTVAVDTSAGH